MLKIVAFLALVVYGHAMVLCPQNACDAVDCAPMDACNGRVKQNGGWCGCCDVCMTTLGEGESCFQMYLLGAPQTVECADGLECSRQSMKCVKKSSPAVRAVTVGACLKKKEEIRLSQQNGMPLIGVTEPHCDTNGNFAAVQCMGSVCYCVDEMGNDIQGYKAGIGELANMNCQCARDLTAYMKTGLIGKLFFCADNGNYKPGQGPAATTTAQPVLLAGSQTGSGSVQTGTNAAASGPCSQELLAAQGSNLLGTFVPECDADGKYTPRQCQGSECYCVRKDGTKIAGYSAPISMKDHTTCQCARDKDMYEKGGLLGVIHTCRANGNYQQYQCLGSVCYCTDDSGVRMGDQSVSIGNINDLKC